MQSYSHDDYFERSDGLKRAWLAPGEPKARAPRHDEPQHGRCLVALVMHVLLRVIACRMEQGLLVIEHHAEIAHVRLPATSVNAAIFLPHVRLASRKLPRRLSHAGFASMKLKEAPIAWVRWRDDHPGWIAAAGLGPDLKH
jgi:hypothetical protein